MAEGFSAPDVSIVIPTRDREEMLARAVRSCFESAGERSIEVIVSIDGAAATYAAALEQADGRVRRLRAPTAGGRGRARNAGLAAARGRYVKFLDDDDWLAAGALAAEIAHGDATGADIVASGHRVAGHGVREQIHWPPPFADGIDSLLRGEAVPTAAALYRREILDGVQWTEQPCKLDDWHFFLCAALRARSLVPVRTVAYTWFSHAGQVVQHTERLDHVRDFYWILDELERALAAMGQLTGVRRSRLAQYRYKELQALCELDRNAFNAEADRILELDARFHPRDEERRPTMRLLARAVGFRRAVRMRVALKDILGRH